MRKAQKKSGGSLDLSGAGSGLGPENFALGSAESRVGARMLVGNRQDTRKRIEFVSHIAGAWRGPGPEPPTWNKVPRALSWQECADGRLFRMVYVPIHWEKEPRDGVAPVCPDCGTPYRREDGYEGWALFVANCLERHVLLDG